MRKSRRQPRRWLKVQAGSRPRTPAVPIPDEGGTITDLLPERVRPEADTVLTGGDIDADWQRAADSGEEAVGGSAATPDQDVVDEIGHALGVEQADEAPMHTSDEILQARRRHYWHLERLAAEEADRKER